VQIPYFPHINHPLVKSLFDHSDQELLTLFQKYPDSGKYFTVIFCRYSSILYTLSWHSARSPVQADYLFAVIWRHIFYQLGKLDLSSQDGLTLQNWLINMTGFYINKIELPLTETIHYSLENTSPPLWCYIEQALDQLPPRSRLMILMSQRFHWSETKIAAYLQAEGEEISLSEVTSCLEESYRMLEANLPADIRAIYLNEN
jgi:hypothetical protein